MVTPLGKAMQLCPLSQKILSERQLHQEMARCDGCLLVASKVRASNPPKLQSPWLILKGSWFAKMQVTEWWLAPCSGVHQQFLADQWSVQSIEQRYGSFGRLFNTSQMDAKGRLFVREILHRLEVLFWLWGQPSQMFHPPVLEISLRANFQSPGLLCFYQRSTTALSQVVHSQKDAQV